MFRVSISGIIADFAKMGNICKDLLKKCKAMEQPRSGPLRERRLKAGKMLRWSILSESPSSCAAKGASGG